MTKLNVSIPKHNGALPVFGYRMSKSEVAQQVGYNGITVMDEEPTLEAGHYFDGLIFGSVTFERVNDKLPLTKFPNAILDITQSDNVIKTPLIISRNNHDTLQISDKPIREHLEKRGTFKEFASMGDSQISISGVLVSPKGSMARPNDQIQQLVAWREYGQAIKVVNETLQHLNIFSLVIESVHWLPSKYMNTQPFRLNCLSDDERLYNLVNG